MSTLISLPKAQKLLDIPGTRGKRLKTILLNLERHLGVELMHRIRTPGGRVQWRVSMQVMREVLPEFTDFRVLRAVHRARRLLEARAGKPAIRRPEESMRRELQRELKRRSAQPAEPEPPYLPRRRQRSR